MNSKILIIALSITILLIYSCEDSVSPPPSESKIDTVYVIDTLGGDLTQNYFPLTVGNSWSYNISLIGCHNGCVISGIIKWKVNSLKDSLTGTKVYLLEEEFDGYRIEDYEIDKTYEKSRAVFIVIQNEYQTISIIPANQHRVMDSAGVTIDFKRGAITWLPLIVFQAIFNEDENEIVNLTNVFYRDELAYEFYAESAEDHNITLKKNIGITRWEIQSTHTGGWRGSLNMIDYFVH